MSRRRFLWAMAGLAGIGRAQTPEESCQVFTEPPRLFLRPQRLRLVQRERERRSMRWEQFETLMAGRAQMREPGFALALYYRVAADQEAARRAVQWALGAGGDLRQQALVYDWCQEALDEAQAGALAARLQRGIERGAAANDVATVRARVLAAVALAGRLPKVSEAELRRTVNGWWRGRVAPALKRGQPIAREDHYALFELLHALRDNLNLDLRLDVPCYFKQLPLYQLMSYYPAPYAAPENEYRIPAAPGAEADLERATLSRAAEMAMLAYEPNAQETQYLQGWLMHDRFLMRSTFGITYEYLWANPYHPGLSYYNLPLSFHDELFGRLFLRSSWDDDAQWLGCFGGQLQLFEDGRPRVLKAAGWKDPIRIGEAVVLAAGNPPQFTLKEAAGAVYIVGLKPRARYDVEVDDEEMREDRTDPGGILELAAGTHGSIRLREAGVR